MARVFLAIDLPNHLKSFIEQEQVKWKQVKSGVKWVRPNLLHLTLKFLGEVPEEQLPTISESLKDICNNHPSFSLSLNGIGVFPTPVRPKVFWIGLAGELDKLKALHTDIETNLAQLGFAVEKRKFSPHITIARAKTNKNLNRLVTELAKTKLPTAPFGVDNVVLYKSILSSQGPKYIPIIQNFLLTS